MDMNTPHFNSWPTKLVLRVSKTLSTSKSYSTEHARKQDAKIAEKRARKFSKYNGGTPSPRKSMQDDVNELGERNYSMFSDDTQVTDLGSTRRASKNDHTEMLHGLTHHDSFDSLVDGGYVAKKLRHFDDLDPEEKAEVLAISEKHEKMIASLPANIWDLIASYLEPADRAHLVLTNRTLHDKLGTDHFKVLNDPENHHHKIKFLAHLDRHLPGHLLCFLCGQYHQRTRRGSEKLMVDYVANPLFDCPSVKSSVLPRMRLTHGREFPYAFVQLAVRASQHGDDYGITAESLGRKWKDPTSEWSHHTRYLVHDGRLLLRVRSQAWAPPKLTATAERHLLFDREEYTPYFSVCAHWRDGMLMPVCKCALSHVPEQPQSAIQQLKKAPTIKRDLINPKFIVRGCDTCQPARRCPECPSEYLVEINMAEDKDDPVHRFKHVIVVTRWTDLGDGSSPVTSPEWCAINGILSGYASFSQVGRRAVGGIFESKVSGSIPGQRMVSMNPDNVKEGEEGTGWY